MEGGTSSRPPLLTSLSCSHSPAKKRKITNNKEPRIVFQIFLKVDGKRIKIQVEVYFRDGNSSSNDHDVFVNLENEANKEKMQLQFEDLLFIEQPSSILGITRCDGLNTSLQGQDKIRIFKERQGNGINSITMDVSQYVKLQEYSSYLRFMVGWIKNQEGRKELQITKLFVLTIMDDEIMKLYKLNIFEGSLEKDIRKAWPCVEERMRLIEKTLLIPHEETMDTFHDNLFLHWYRDFQLTNICNHILKFIEMNEMK